MTKCGWLDLLLLCLSASSSPKLKSKFEFESLPIWETTSSNGTSNNPSYASSSICVASLESTFHHAPRIYQSWSTRAQFMTTNFSAHWELSLFPLDWLNVVVCRSVLLYNSGARTFWKKTVGSILNSLTSLPCHVYDLIELDWSICPHFWFAKCWTPKIDKGKPWCSKYSCLLIAIYLSKGLHGPIFHHFYYQKGETLWGISTYHLGFKT